VDHILFDQLEKLRIVNRKLRREKGVYLLRSSDLGILVKKYNAVHMRETTFLKLDDKHISEGLSKNSILYVLDELLLLCIEGMDDQIRAISCSLTWEKLVLDFWPGWICSHGEKEICTLEVAIDGQSVLKKLLHVACAACKRWWQNNPLTERLKMGIDVCSHSVCQARVDLAPNVVLVQHNKA
jgi:hypothetical protein